MTSWKAIAPTVVIVMALILVFASGSIPTRAQEGDVVCLTCHEDVGVSFAESPHGRAFQFGKTGGDCRSCHGSAEKHVDDQSVPGDLILPGKSSAEAVNAQCYTCHGNEPTQGYWEGSHHESAGLSCADCHSVHSAWPTHKGKQVESQLDLCVSCHSSQRKQMTQRSHHPFREGKIECVSCHSPHGSGTPNDLKADSPNDQCYSCHQDKRGPFLWEHSPVREDCMTCHKPHGSNHEGMLVTRTAQLCESCHLQGRHQTIAGAETAMWNVGRQCLNCHTAIHGSNHPSGPLFQR